MHEGKIIRFYRLDAKLTQSDLGKGICSKSHVSKIETEQTDYSSEITMLLAKRLNIDMKKELRRYKQIGDFLSTWNDEIISMRKEEIKRIKKVLDDEKLVHISDYNIHYILLKARYYLSLNQPKKAKLIINQIEKIKSRISPYEQNLLKHVAGIYFLSINDYKNAVKMLRSINNEAYNNPEYYYNLAVAYRHMNSHSKAYYYADKSLQFFTKTNRFLRIIDAETLLLSLEGSVKEDNFQDTVRKYESLIQNCNLCNDDDGKVILMYNLAYEYYKRRHYETAAKLFKQLMTTQDQVNYLFSLNYYILSQLKIDGLNQTKLLELVSKGYTIALDNNIPVLIHIFKLLQFTVEQFQDKYYKYIETHALPSFKENGYENEVTQKYERDLLIYLVKQKEHEKALKLSLNMLNIHVD